MKTSKTSTTPKCIKPSELEPVPPEVAAIQPYVDQLAPLRSGGSHRETLEGLKNVPYDQSYIARMLNALTLAFCDFDNASLKVDLACLGHEQLEAVATEVIKRASQFNLLVKTVAQFAGGAE